MLSRYLQLSALVIVVALATGYVVHRVAGHTDFSTGCQFQMALPATSTVPTTDVLVFNRRVALDAIDRAPVTEIFTATARETGIAAGTIASAQQILPASDSSFNAVVTYSDAAGAVKIANSLCNHYVQQLTSQVTADFAAEAASWRGRLRYLQSQLDGLNRSAGAKPTALYFRQREALLAAIDRTKNFLAVTYTTPQYNISVLAPAVGAASHNTKPSLSKSLIIAAASGLLASFLIILAIETARGRREES
jgi:hypothetical protein